MRWVRIQTADFNALEEKQRLQRISAEVGAIVEFTGCVRASPSSENALRAIFLEHYPKMTEKSVHLIIDQAFLRWPLMAITVIHRVGELSVGENIVYVGVSSKHRKSALQCIDFIMDYLKNDVPLWKKEILTQQEEWVTQKQTDIDAKDAWH
jgi:molybdopterin synthase catalytic subunit